MIRTLVCYWGLLSPGSRRRQVFLLLLAALSGFVELVSVGLVIPFIALAADALPFGPAKSLVRTMVDLLTDWGVPPSQHTLALGIIFLLCVLSANLYICFYQSYASWFTAAQRTELATRVGEALCWRPLEWIEGRHSSELSKVVLADVYRINGILLTLTQVTSVLARSLMAAVFLALAQPRLAVALAVPLAIGYWVVFQVLQRPLSRAGVEANRAEEELSKSLVEILGGARELRVGNLENSFFQRLNRAAEEGRWPGFIRALPGHFTRAGLEVVTVAVVVVLLVYFHIKDGNLANGLPLMSAYAVAGIRLLPAVQQSLFLFFEVRYFAPSLFTMAEMLQGFEPPRVHDDGTALGLEREVSLQEVSYAYPGSHSTLDRISLTIAKNSRVAFVGATGAGKSTLVDLILGLRFPQRGQLCIDGKPLTPERVRAWRRNLGYVPQAIFLLDQSIAENIALGCSAAELDIEGVYRAARLANIDDFIQTLPEGYATAVGERGVRLSGGQCQRIGIARALYHDPEVVVFDEATSSLDSVTETAVLEAFDRLKAQKTLIVIAHRLKTVWDFDQIFVLEQGRLISHGRSEELMQQCSKFRELALVGGLG